jgi:hypothetical protein
VVEDSYDYTAEIPVEGSAYADYTGAYSPYWSSHASASSSAGAFEVSAAASAFDSAGADSLAESTYLFSVAAPNVQLPLYGSYDSIYGHPCGFSYSLWDATMSLLINEASWSWYVESGTIEYLGEYWLDVTHEYVLALSATASGSSLDGASCAAHLRADVIAIPEPAGFLLIGLSLLALRRR